MLYSTSTRPGEGAIYRYLSRQGKIAGDIHETKSSGLSLSWSPRALARGGSTKMAISRAGRWAIATDGTFSLGYLTFPLLAGKLDIFSIGFCLERE